MDPDPDPGGPKHVDPVDPDSDPVDPDSDPEHCRGGYNFNCVDVPYIHTIRNVM